MKEPTGNVTFLFTDIEGSTMLSQQFAGSYPAALEKHNSILNNAVKSYSGFVFKTVGDAFCCAFQNADDAVIAACDIQKLLINENWNEVVIKVRIGIHSGNAEWNGEDYMGYITLARVSRVMSAANGGQIIISDKAYELYGNTKQLNSDKIKFRDLGERKLKDVIQPIKLFQIISSGLREDFPPLKTLDARPNNVPVQLTNFIGREESMKSAKELLNQTRLLTMLGSGGIGKSRLALQVGADMIDEFANGVFIAELAPVNDPDFILQTLMNSFGFKDESGKTAEEILKDHLKDKELLLILDNCEHLIKECAVTVEMLLSNSTNLKIITTSRESLNCSGEKIFSVPSLRFRMFQLIIHLFSSRSMNQ
ncbi:MAG: adenylate/guanylate cyclase domain-containing protein [Ignavibacteria bacterium]|nr:adenylate/guanylate cyclase domain-containing protein [Ignavibacteria bacterium]